MSTAARSSAARAWRVARLVAVKDLRVEWRSRVVLNQVLVSFGDAQRTQRVISAIQADGTCWCGGTVWQGKTAMRISVSSWKTTIENAMAAALVIVECADRVSK